MLSLSLRRRPRASLFGNLPRFFLASRMLSSNWRCSRLFFAMS